MRDFAITDRMLKTLDRVGRHPGLSKISRDMRDRITKHQWREHRKTFGKLYPDKTFYVIRVRQTTSSLGPLMQWVCERLEMCERKQYIPVVDFSFFENVLLEKEEVGRKINPWEYYFEQPTMYGTQAAYHAKNVIVGNANSNVDGDDIIDNHEKLKEYCAIYEKYIHINKRIEKKAEEIRIGMIHPEWRVLGCVYRGTDFRNRRVVNEHRQPSLDELIEKAQELMEQWKCDHIFLATEDGGGVKRFREVFQDKLVCVERKRYPSNVKITQEFRLYRKQNAYYKAEAYLTEIYILSRCNCLLSSRVGILMAVLPMNNMRYEHRYIYDLGIYTRGRF